MRGHYPQNWEAIAQVVKDAAGWRCEHCGHPHEPEAGYTLTVHHLDGNKSNCTPCNLVALCQRCHLRIQATYLPGQRWLWCEEAPAWAWARGLVKTWEEAKQESLAELWRIVDEQGQKDALRKGEAHRRGADGL